MGGWGVCGSYALLGLALLGSAVPSAEAEEIADVMDSIPDSIAEDVREEDSAFAESVGSDWHGADCSTSSQCQPCMECVSGGCVAAPVGGSGCTKYQPCGKGYLCLPSAVTECATECVDTECATNADCGTCGLCQLLTGTCSFAKAQCFQDSDCPKPLGCVLGLSNSCWNYCTYKQSVPDAVGADGISDSASADSDSAGLDLGPVTDSAGNPGDDAGDLGISDGADGAMSDAVSDAVLGAASGAPSGQSSGCSSGPLPETGWLWAAFSVVALARGRRSRSVERHLPT